MTGAVGSTCTWDAEAAEGSRFFFLPFDNLLISTDIKFKLEREIRRLCVLFL